MCSDATSGNTIPLLGFAVSGLSLLWFNCSFIAKVAPPKALQQSDVAVDAALCPKALLKEKVTK